MSVDGFVVAFGGLGGVIILSLTAWHNWVVRQQLRAIERNTRGKV